MNSLSVCIQVYESQRINTRSIMTPKTAFISYYFCY